MPQKHIPSLKKKNKIGRIEEEKKKRNEDIYRKTIFGHLKFN